MSYVKQNFVTGQILQASQLNAMDDQIAENENPIKHTAQELTTAQQMQARENLGLYRSEGERASIEWDGDITGKSEATIGNEEQSQGLMMYKVSDALPSADDLIGAEYIISYATGAQTITGTNIYQYDETAYSINSTFGEIIVVGTAGDHTFTIPGVGEAYLRLPESGIYFFAYEAQYVSSLTYGSETVHKIEEKYLPDTTATKSYVGNAINGVQTQIDALVSKSDVVDVVGTYAELQAYDTSTLANNDVVKVLSDSTHSDSRSYYRWVVTDDIGEWEYVGSESVGYTKAETDAAIAAAIGNAIGGEY